MKRTRMLLSAAVMLLLVKNADAQGSLGGQLNFTNYAGYSIHNLGVGVHADYTNDRLVYRGTLNFAFPSKRERTYDLVYNNGDLYTSNQMYAKTITGHEKYSGLGLWLDANYFLTGDGEDGGLYGMAGLGLSMMTISYDMETYDRNMYATVHDYDKKDRLFQPIIRLGIGYDHRFDFGNLYIHAFGNLPANSVGGAAIEVNLPFSFGAAAGVRIPMY